MLPVVDIGNFSSGDGARRSEVAARIGAACESIGFMYVSNHSVSQATIDAAVAATRSFFALPMEARQACARRLGNERYSISYFASPHYESTVQPLPGVAVDDAAPRPPALHAGRAFAAVVAQFDAL